MTECSLSAFSQSLSLGWRLGVPMLAVMWELLQVILCTLMTVLGSKYVEMEWMSFCCFVVAVLIPRHFNNV